MTDIANPLPPSALPSLEEGSRPTDQTAQEIKLVFQPCSVDVLEEAWGIFRKLHTLKLPAELLFLS